MTWDSPCRQCFCDDPAIFPTIAATTVPQHRTRIRGCTFSLKPLSGPAGCDRNATWDSWESRRRSESRLEPSPAVISSAS